MSQHQKSENVSEPKEYKINYSPASIRDLDRIWLDVYSASQSFNITEKYINDLMDAIESKSLFPLSGAPLYYGNMFTGYYFVVFKLYIVFYRADEESVYVDRVLLGKSDYMSLLGFAAILEK